MTAVSCIWPALPGFLMAEIDCRPQASFPRCWSESLHALSVLFFKAFIIGLCPLPSLKWRALAEESCKTDVSVVLGLYSESRASLSAGPRGWAELATFSDSLKTKQSGKSSLSYETVQHPARSGISPLALASRSAARASAPRCQAVFPSLPSAIAALAATPRCQAVVGVPIVAPAPPVGSVV